MATRAKAPAGGPRPTAPDANPLFEVATYLVAAARDCVDEPQHYGPLRMVEATSRLIAASQGLDGAQDPWLASMRERIEREKYIFDPQAFVTWIDDVLRAFTKETLRRNGVAPAHSSFPTLVEERGS